MIRLLPLLLLLASCGSGAEEETWTYRIPLMFEPWGIYVNADIDGQTERCLLDTGGSGGPMAAIWVRDVYARARGFDLQTLEGGDHYTYVAFSTGNYSRANVLAYLYDWPDDVNCLFGLDAFPEVSEWRIDETAGVMEGR